MDGIIREFNNLYNDKINLIKQEHYKSTNLINELNQTIGSLKDENLNLKKRIGELVEEKKSKSSSALWETTQSQLKEKDIVIEQLKKEIDFYKRNSNKNFVKDTYP